MKPSRTTRLLKNEELAKKKTLAVRHGSNKAKVDGNHPREIMKQRSSARNCS
jgi:hypothetical protein